MGAPVPPRGPDFSLGLAMSEIPEEGSVPGRVGDDPVILSRFGGSLFAVGGACSHYGAALADGLFDRETVRCPLHHACFSLRSGAALRAPAFDPLGRWQVEVDSGRVFVRARLEAAITPASSAAEIAEPGSILIIGGGAAGFACADELRRLGFAGRLTIVTADADPPCDRPNLSKDFLAGTAPEAWIPLRDESWYRDHDISLELGEEVLALDIPGRIASTRSGRTLAWDRLLLATGAEPVRLPGFDGDDVHMLRSLTDARGLAERARPGARCVILGSSFIGMESAAALRSRGVEVDIVSLDPIPFAGLFGADIGRMFQHLHEDKGVRFHLARTAASFDGRNVSLDDHSTLAADFVLVGVGVRPRLALATGRMKVADGILVDSSLATSVPGIWAAGDVASYPDPFSGDPIRIEHWVTAQRQGQVAARNMLGIPTSFVAMPFFWTEQYGVAFRYVGHGRGWDEIRIDGDLEAHDFIARFLRGGVVRASLSCGRDLDLLGDEQALEHCLVGLVAEPAETGPSVSSASLRPMTIGVRR